VTMRRLCLHACVLLLVAAQGCTKKSEKQTGGRQGGRAGELIAVKVAPATMRQAPRSISVVSPLEGRNQADVYTKVTGRLTYIGPREGASVKRGDLLFRIDRSDPGESFLAMPIVSPIDGWVGRWMVTNIGTQINAQAPVVTIVDDSFLRTTIFLSTHEWAVMDPAAKVSVTVGDETRLAKIVSIARAADRISGRGSSIVEVENKNHTWRVGMIARVQVDLEPKPRMLVSSAAVNITDQGAYVFQVEEDGESKVRIARKKAIRYSLVDSDTIEILDGVADGAAVVIAGGNLLTDGAKVNVVGDEPGQPQNGNR